MPTASDDHESGPLARDYTETPGHLIRHAQQVHTQLWAELVPVDITGSQYSILSALSMHGDLDQVTVGRLTSLDKSSVGELASRMASRGLIERSRDARDGRRKVLHITEEGASAVARAAPYVHRVGQRFLAPLDERERAQFMDCLRRVGNPANRE
jgi:DNA-binding MarR family transcriptional regulator